MNKLQNMGTIDRIIRVIIGIGVLSLLIFIQADAKYWALLGLIPLLTGIFGICPLYMLFGFKTTKKAS